MEAAAAAERSWVHAMWRGAIGRCPECGQGRLWQGYLKTHAECSHCQAPLGQHRADDAPPYFTIFIVGHVLIPMVVMVEIAYQPSYWLHALVWLPLALAMTFALMPVVKGAIVGLQWALRMHGFADTPSEP
jgi:uncharacterized protein (DUF983 family)